MGNMTTLQILQGIKTWVTTKLNLKQDVINDLANIRSGAQAGSTAVQPAELSAYFNDASYDNNTHRINFYHGQTVVAYVDASPFIIDGMVDDVRIENGYLVIDFNTESGKQDISIPLTDIFNPNNYYNKTQTDGLLAQKQDVIQDLADIRSGASAGSTAVQPSTLNNAVKNVVAESGVYDVSANNDNTKFESLSALLSSANLNTLIPTDIRKGGMSIKFVLSSDNNYVQYLYHGISTAVAAFTNVNNWQRMDDKVSIAIGKNLLNKDKCLKDKYINKSTGDVASNSGTYATDFIPVSESGLVCNYYYIGGTVIGAAVYNTNKAYLRSCPNPYVYQEGDGYVRYTIKNVNNLEYAQVEVGSVSTQFQPYNVIDNYLDGVRSYRYIIQNSTNANILEKSIKTVFIDPDLIKVTDIDIIHYDNVIKIFIQSADITTWRSVFDKNRGLLENEVKYALNNAGDSIGYIVFKNVDLLSGLGSISGHNLINVDIDIANNKLYDTTPCVSDIWNANLGNLAVDNSKIKPNEVIRAKVGKNLANPEDFIEGYFTNKSAGTIYPNNILGITGYIPASVNGLVCNHANITSVSGGGVYDAKMKFLRGVTNPYVYQAGDAFVTFDFYLSDKNVIQVEEGSVSTSYEKYSQFAGLSDVITVNSITFKTVEAGKNKVNPADIELNKYINRNTGAEISLSGFDVTGFIPVSKKGLICNHPFEGGIAMGSAVYDTNKVYKRALYSQYTYQDGDGYVRYTFNHDYINSIQVEEGSVSTAYEPYTDRTVLLPELIPTIEPGEEDEKENIISLPNKIYAVVGDTLQIFFKGIIMSVDALKYNIKVSCSKGTIYHRYFQYTPQAADVGTVTFAVTVRDDYGNIINTKSCQLVTVNVAGSPSVQKNVLCIGDSLTAGGQWPAEAYRRLTASGGTPEGKNLSNISFVGSMTKNSAGYEGHSGWSWGDYTTSGRSSSSFRFYLTSGTAAIGDVYSNNGHNYTVNELQVIDGVNTILCSASSSSDTPSASGTLTKVSGTGDSTLTYSSASPDSANPFWDSVNNKMTFIPFVDTYCNGTVDAIYVLLGGNALAAWKVDFSDTLAHIKTFADTLHTEYPNCKLMLMNMQLPSMKLMMPGYGASGNYSDTYGILVSLFRQNQVYQDFANDDDYKDWVEFVNLSSQFDSDYNFPISQNDVNTRNSSEKDSYANNTLHPANSGYYQYADVVFRNFVANFCQ